MKSRTSFFNRGFARDLWRRTWPLWAGYLLILLLFGPMNMLNQLQYPAYNYVSGKANFNYSLASGGELLLWLSLGMGCLAVMAVFSFLYNSRGCGMVNSFPMSRTETFWTCYLTGLLPLLAADLLTAGLTALFCPGGYLDGSTVLALLGVAVFSNVFFYSFASFCAMLTGSLLVLPLAYALLNFAAVVAEVTVQEVLSYVVYGLGSFTTVQLGFLSPLVGMLKRYRVGYVNWPTEIAIEGLGALALYALAGFAFALLAWALYRRRQMETSGDSVAIPALKPIFQVCMCFGAAFVFAEVIYSLPNIVWRGRQAALVVLGLLLVGAFLGWFAARMIIEKSLHVFRGHWGGFLICAAMLIVLVGACEFDLFGYERRVPDANEVESVKLYGDTLREPENIAAAVASTVA